MGDGPCVCGHSPEEHGGDPHHPGSTACRELDPYGNEDCPCIAYEEDQDEGDL